MIDYLKAFHLIFIVTWFAGLFYIVRLFIYQTEAKDKSEIEQNILIPQFKIMAKRLWYGITWPSMILVLIFGSWLIIEQSFLLKQTWMLNKLLMVSGLVAYHLLNHKIFKELMEDKYRWNSIKLRLWNELATVFLFAIVFTVMVFRYNHNVVVGVLGIVGVITSLVLAVMAYKKFRTKKK